LKFLVDQPISWEVAKGLVAAGHDALHVRDLGMEAAADLPILERAASEGRIVVTQDTDYGTLLVTGQRTSPSIVLFRMRDGRPSVQLSVLLQYLPELEPSLEEGAIVVFGEASIRIRQLRPQ
jgi:predicted nuclease of predicted toxin-antitoxin system